jgi:nitrate reductase NapE component
MAAVEAHEAAVPDTKLFKGIAQSKGTSEGGNGSNATADFGRTLVDDASACANLCGHNGVCRWLFNLINGNVSGSCYRYCNLWGVQVRPSKPQANVKACYYVLVRGVYQWKCMRKSLLLLLSMWAYWGVQMRPSKPPPNPKAYYEYMASINGNECRNTLLLFLSLSLVMLFPLIILSFSEHSVNIHWTFSELSVNLQWTFGEPSVNIRWIVFCSNDWSVWWSVAHRENKCVCTVAYIGVRCNEARILPGNMQAAFDGSIIFNRQ